MKREVRLVARAGKGQTLVLNEGSQVIGRSSVCDHQLPAASISAQHCRIECSGAMVVLRDLGSTNGTYVNGTAATRTMLDRGDKVQLGTYEFEIEIVTVKVQGDSTVQTTSEYSWILDEPTPLPESMDESALFGDAPGHSVHERTPNAAFVFPDPPSITAQAPAPVPQTLSRRPQRSQQQTRDWSTVTDFLQAHLRSLFVLSGSGLAALLFLVPWAWLAVPSDEELCGFYETTLASVITMRTTGATPTDWDLVAAEAMEQNEEYVSHLQTPGLSPQARVLLIAGRDYLEKIFIESRLGPSVSEDSYRQKVVAARNLIGGESLLGKYEDPTTVTARKAASKAALEAMNEMYDEQPSS